MVIHLQDRRIKFAGIATKLQHATAGIPLLLTGMEKLGGEGELAIALLEIAIALLVLGAFVREVRAARKEHHASHDAVSWFDLAAAGMLMFEAFYGHSHKPGYLRPQFFSAVATLGLALFHRRIHERRARRRFVKLDENGIEVRTGWFSRFTAAWADIDRIHVADGKATFHRNDGGAHALQMKFLSNHEEVHTCLAEHARAAGVSVEGRAPETVSCKHADRPEPGTMG